MKMIDFWFFQLYNYTLKKIRSGRTDWSIAVMAALLATLLVSVWRIYVKANYPVEEIDKLFSWTRLAWGGSFILLYFLGKAFYFRIGKIKKIQQRFLTQNNGFLHLLLIIIQLAVLVIFMIATSKK